MSVRFILVMVACSWSLLAEGAPAIPTKLNDEGPHNENNDLEQLSLPNFSSGSSDIDVNQTVDQVEQILKAYPSLPRLTKVDILTLLNNITTEDKKQQQKKSEKRIAQKSKATNTKSNRAADSKPLMVVLPFKAGDTTNGDVTELYTKAPIIRYISPKPVRGKDDVVDSESAFTNHKYTDEDTTKKTKHTLQDDYWHNEAQRVMNDLKKQSDIVGLKHALKEKNNTDSKEVPFKKMPTLENEQGFNPKLPIISKDTFSQSDEQTETLPSGQSGESNGPSLPENVNDFLQTMGLYEKDKIAEKYPFKFIDTANIDTMKPMEYSSPSSVLFGQTPLQPFSVTPDSSAYMVFKPLPLGNKPTNEVQNLDDILNSYGIFGAVNEEYLPNLSADSEITIGQDFNKNTEFVQPDLFPADMTSMLTEMGLTNKKGRKLSYLPSESGETLNKNSNSDLDINETDGYRLGAGPDPMSVEEIYPTQNLGELVKRQETEPVTEKLIEIISESTSESNDSKEESTSIADNGDSGDSKSTTEDTEKLADSNSSEKLESPKSEAPNLADLESSFGASPADNDPSEAELPPPRKNGFYYMVDWNSFLEVGDGDTKVNIRFNPKLGDPQRFLAVTVP